MSVPTAASSNSFVGTGAVTVYSTGFYFLLASTVVVKITPAATGVEEILVLGVDYTVTMPLGVGLNGSITMLVAPAFGDELVIERTVPITQLMSLRQQGSFSPAIHEDGFDRAVFIDQQFDRRIAALEALADLTSLATFDAQVVDITLLTDAADVELSFPFTHPVIAPPGKTITGVSIVRVDGAIGDARSPITMLLWDWAGDVLTVGYITGLEPGRNYAFRLLCTQLEP